LDWVRRGATTTGPTVGGNALYSAVGAWMVGAQPAVCAVIGADFPDSILDVLEQAGFDLNPLRRVDGPSFRVLLDDSVPRRAVSYLEPCGHNDTLDPWPHQVRSGWDIAHLAAIPPESQRRLAAALTAVGVPYTLDTIVIPGEIEPAADELIELASGSRAFLPSTDELDALWPADDPVERLTALYQQTRHPVVATCGALGSIGFDGARAVRVPAYDGLVVDTTGAGDAYSGAFAASSALGADLAEAMAWAAAAASVIIESHGAEHALEPGRRRSVRQRAEQVRTATTEVDTHVLER